MSRVFLKMLFAVWTVSLLLCSAGLCWTIPAPVASTSQDSLDPRLAVDANGKAYVVWRERVGGTTFQIWYTDNVAGGFSSPLEISQGGTIHSSSPVVAVAGTEVHAAWARDPASGENCEIWYRRRSAGIWGSTLDASNTSIKSLRPWLSVRGSVGPLVTWDEALYADDNYDILFSEWTGSGFGSAYNVSNTPGGSVYGSVCSANTISPNGDITVVWPDRITGQYHLNARRRVAGVWHARQEISTKETGPAVPGIAAGPDSQVHVVHSAEGSIWYQRWTGSSWTAPTALPGGIGNPLRPKIAVDDQGVAHVVADNSAYGVGEIYYTNNASGSWSAWWWLPPPTSAAGVPACC